MLTPKKKTSLKKSNSLKPLESLTWEDEHFVNHATVYKEGKTEGIAVKTEKKYGKRTQWRASFWLQKDQDVDGILAWLFSSVKKLFSKFWGKKIITPKDLESSKKLITELQKQLDRKEEEFEELKARFTLQQKELALAQEVIGKSEEYETILKNFENKIKNSVQNNERIEEWIKTEIRKHRWILGLDCEVKAKNKAVDPQTGIDLHIETNFGENRIIEAKSPNLPIFKGKTDQRFDLSKDVSVALSEIIEYLQRTQSYSLIRQRGSYSIDKPIGRILAGYNLGESEERLLKEWNFHLAPVIKIITYNDLVNNTKKEIDLIKIAKRLKAEELTKNTSKDKNIIENNQNQEIEIKN